MQPTAKVIVRHSGKCSDRARGLDWHRCNCRKSILVYDGKTRNKDGKLTNRTISAKTRSWSRAESFCQSWLDQFDPEKQELKRLRAEKERKETRIEEAVATFVADKIARLGDNGTVGMIRSLLGHVNPETKQVERGGHFFYWLDRQVPRPAFLSELTPAHLTAWRASWKFDDYTAAQRWGMVTDFFSFCERQGWVQDSPARKLQKLEYERGNRTAIFSDAQYEAVLSAVERYEPENVPDATRKGWKQRLTTFLELLRWSGMALIDAVQFRPELVDDKGVLRYRRQKTSRRTKLVATVPLPAHVVALLRSVPLERDSAGPDQPFRSKDFTPHSDTVRWRKRLFQLFALAGIKKVRTEVGRERPPHPHMLRDTFAVWNLRHGVSIFSLSKMLGHSNPTITAKAYAPFVRELEQAVIDEGRKAIAQVPKRRGKKVVSIA